MPREKFSTEQERTTTIKTFETVFSNRLSELIKIRKNENSTAEIANDLNVTIRIIQLWESKQSRPDIDRLIELAYYFGVTVDYLVGKTDNISPTLEIAEISDKYGLTVDTLEKLEKCDTKKLDFINIMINTIIDNY